MIKRIYIKQEGITLVLIALILLVILMFAGLAIDLSYMYYVKNELQVAADASALAGAALLSNPTDFIQGNARQEAWKFACKNKATKDKVFLESNASTDCDNPPSAENLNSSNNSNGDIVVGNWYAGVFDPTKTPVNTIKTRPQRTGETQGMPRVGLFFGRILNWSSMNASAMAIASRPPRPTQPLSICLKTCTLSVPVFLHLKEQFQNEEKSDSLAWTNFNPTSPTDIGENGDVVKYIHGELTAPDVCCKEIMTNNGVGVPITELQKEFTKQVAKSGLPYWEVIVVVLGAEANACINNPSPVNGCPPGAQPKEPYLVSQYAKIKITSIVGDEPGEKSDPGIWISEINCVPCPATELMGEKAALVK